jgi:conjugative transfer signal peptidase TraF
MPKPKPGHPNRIAARFVALPLFGFAAVVCAAAILGVRINTSSSLPLGLYLVTSEETATLVEFCPAEPYASLSRERGYRSRSFGCSDGAVPLLKPIVARQGDLVDVRQTGISVNGRLLPNTAPLRRDAATRLLSPWPLGRYCVEPDAVWVASTYNPGSFDSRYMGPIEIRRIRQRLRALWLLKG